jgi:hypothetical protein
MQAYCTYCRSRDVTITDERPASHIADNRPAWGAQLSRTTRIPAAVDFTCNDCDRSGTVDV